MVPDTRTFDRSVHTPDILRQIDQLLDRFEDAYRAGRTPDLQAFLDEAPEAVRGEVFRELLLLELTHQPPVDAAAAAASYRQRFPDYHTLIHDVFQGPKTTLAYTGQDPPPPTAPPSAVGAERYELRGELARGGMGIVYDAWDRVLERPVAIKVLTDRAGSGSLATRFVEEARITGQLQHPSIPAVHDLGVLPDGRPFLAMKRIKGETLQTLLQERERLNVLAVFEGICQAVGYAHAHGVIHRDLKPANVMVGAFGEVQVMDWGLAKVLNQIPTSVSEATELDTTAPTEIRTSREADEATRAGSVLGTPAYMPPEQAIGAVDQIDRRSDVFGLGAILCALLTGKPPYLGADAESTRQLAARAKLEEAKERLASCGAEPELVTLCQHCLAPEPNDRPADAGDVATQVAELRAAAEQRAKQAEVERAQAVVRATEQLKRRRVQVALAGTVALLLLSVGAGVWWQDRQAQERRTETLQRELADEQQRQEERLRASRNSDAVATLVERCEAALRNDDTATAALTLDQARKRLADGGADAFGDRIARCVADLTLVQALDDVDLFQWTPLQDRTPPKEEVTTRWLNTLAQSGIVVGQTTPAEVVLQISASNVRHRIVAALDGLLGRGRWHEVRPLLQELDPHDYRDAMRDAVRQLPDHTALQRLIETNEILKQPPEFIAVVVEFATGTTIPLQRRLELLTKALQQRPSNFKLAMTLLYLYPQEQKEWWGERLRWSQAAVAAHPNRAGPHVLLGDILRNKEEWEWAVSSYREALRLQPNLVAAHNNLGLALHDKGDRDGAIASFRDAIRLSPKLAEPHVNLAATLRAKGDVDGAIASSREAIKLNPKLAVAHNSLAMALQDNRNPAEAINHFREALRLDPTYVYAHNNLGVIFLEEGDLDGAIASCREAIKLQPTYAEAHNNLGLILRKKGDLDGAIASCRKAIQLNPKLLAPYANLCDTLAKKGDFNEAFAICHEAISLNPKYAPFHISLGLVFRDSRNAIEAINSFREAIRLNPTSAEAHSNLGLMLREKGDWDGALASCREAIKLQPTDAGWHNNLGLVLLKKGDWDEAITKFRDAIKYRQTLAEPYFNVGLALTAKGDRDGAIASYRDAIKLQPTYAEAYYHLGLTLAAKGDRDGAIASYRDAIRSNPKYAVAHYGLGYALFQKRNYDEAIECCRAILKWNPTHANAMNLMGISQYGKGDVDGAIDSLKKAIQYDPKNAIPRINLGDCYRKNGSITEAIASYREALKLEPKNVKAHMTLGDCYVKNGNVTEAIASYREAAKLDPAKAKNWATFLLLGNDLLKEKIDVDGAIASFREAIRLNPNSNAAYNNLGNIFMAKDVRDEAIDCFRNVVRIDPKNAHAWNNIAWMLATGPEEMRNGKQAVQDALKACELTQWQSPVFLDTLGAAYAQAGDFDKASEYAKKALTFPDFEKRHGAEVRRHLELYQQKKALPPPQPRTETPKDKPKP